ncbi:MAG: diguanylate cyclase [Planctomycetota bacterium]|jgi:diguanylate cyclase (GGDEF)-like protein
MNLQPHREPQLLAIDDSPEIHELLKAHLKHERLEIHSATSGQEGLDTAQALLPDVILMDLDLPDLDGFSILRELKADPRTHEIPVIFVSDTPQTANKVRGFEMGAIDFVTKPFDIAELKARLRSALRLRSLINMLAQRAQLDGLTGLWNRSYFDQRLDHEVADASRYGNPLSLIMCDLDHFKSINDNHGHPFGDLVLEEFARLLSHNRKGDIPCRYGGEEFAIILPHTGIAAATRVADRLRESLKSLRWVGHEDLVVTGSFGVADLECVVQPTSAAMIDTADHALYGAKQVGRDRVEVAPRRDDTLALTG